MKDLFILKKQYNFYNEYHKNSYNKCIHYLCIPVLVFSLFILLNYIPYDYHISYLENYTLRDITFDLSNSNTIFSNTTLDNIFLLNTSGCLYILYITYYLILNVLTGIICIPFYGIILLCSNYIVYNYYHRSWVGALFFQCVSWLFQFLGHYCCENNKPALCNSLIKSVLIAPFFVIFDLLYMCGYKKKVFKQDIFNELLP